MSHQPNSPWNDEILVELKRLAAEGLSGSEIAAGLHLKFRISVTRRSVIGKMNREGIKLSGKQPANFVGKRKHIRTRDRIACSIVGAFNPPVRLAPPLVPLLEQEPLPANAFAFSEGVSLVDHKIGQCRWPNDGSVFGGSFRFCGKPTMDPDNPACPYCHQHYERAHGRGSFEKPSGPSERRAA